MAKSIMTDDMEHCYLCKSPYVEIHHIINGYGNRKQSDIYGLTIPLCRKCHELVHANQDLDLQLKRKTQLKFEQLYSHEKFMATFNKNYK